MRFATTGWAVTSGRSPTKPGIRSADDGVVVARHRSELVTPPFPLPNTNESLRLIGVGKPGLHRLPSLRTGRAVFPHPALRSVFNSVMEVGARVPGLF